MAKSKHDLVVEWARSNVGQREEPLGSNRGAFVEFCQAHTWLKGSGWPWCAAFVVTAIEEGAGVLYPDPTAGAWDLLARAARRGWAKPANWKLVKPGDIVVFNIGSGHTGIVTKVTSKQVFSVDGNAGDAVRECGRPLSVVRGFVCWPEDLPGRARSPLFQVVRSASGTRKLAVGRTLVALPSVKDKVT